MQRILKIDISKATHYLKWKPLLNFKETIQYTINGYTTELDKTIDVYDDRVKQIKQYFEGY